MQPLDNVGCVETLSDQAPDDACTGLFVELVNHSAPQLARQCGVEERLLVELAEYFVDGRSGHGAVDAKLLKPLQRAPAPAAAHPAFEACRRDRDPAVVERAGVRKPGDSVVYFCAVELTAGKAGTELRS